MEEACYRRNVDKEGLSKKVVDSRTIKGARTAHLFAVKWVTLAAAGLHEYPRTVLVYGCKKQFSGSFAAVSPCCEYSCGVIVSKR